MHAILDRIREASSILQVIQLTDELVRDAMTHPDAGARADTVRRALLAATADASDTATAIAAAHALAAMPSGPHDASVRELLEGNDWLAPHLAWALACREPIEPFLGALVGLVAGGRLGGMLAQRTLILWAHRGASSAISQAIMDRLVTAGEPSVRGRLAETLGVVEGPATELVRMAGDPTELTEARVAAVAALGDRTGGHETHLAMLGAHDDEVGRAARLALTDRRWAADGSGRCPDGRLRVAQVHLGGRLDRELAHAGEGDTGGIATLLVQLGAALAADPRVAVVTTIGRGTAAEALASPPPGADGHAVVSVPLGRHEELSFAGAWPAAVAAERGLRRILRQRPASVLHLRMADVGSLAAWRIARRRGLPTVFTLAPDPHAVIDEMERGGELDRASFGLADLRGALWFRARLVRRLANDARQVALFPRPELADRLRQLVGIDIQAAPGRYHIIPEGVDIEPIEQARRTLTAGETAPAPVISELRTAIGRLPADRLGLPLVVSVGRLAEVKGMARLVAAFAEEVELRGRANLLVVGGDLADPTVEERAELDRIEAVVARSPHVRDALILLGHRPHDDILRLLAVAAAGDGGWIAPGGAYASGSRKEEFGLAIVEALASGLPVVAPRVGGPPSYVEDRITGRLVDTMDRRSLAAGIVEALDLAGLDGRAERARQLVRSRYTIGAMAESLVPVYAVVAGQGESVAA